MAKKPRIPAILGPFVFAYPHITSPDTEGTYADNKYKVDGVAAPTSAAMVQAQDALKAALKTLGLPAKGTNLPIKKQTEKVDGKKKETGDLFLRCKSQYAPAIVDASGKPIPAAKLKNLKVGAGTEGRLEGYFSSYVTTDKIKDKETGEVETVETPGVSFTLTGVQLLKVVGGASSGGNFGAYEGGGFTCDDVEDADDELDIGADGDDDDGGLDI